MIILNLQCADGHRFEGWFASRDAFDRQAGRGEVHCALCQSESVSVLPSALRVLRSHGDDAVAASPPPHSMPSPSFSSSPEQQVAQKLFQALATLARQAENVGSRFPEEARRIHYDEVPPRSIRGQATREETEELLDEGILVLPAPVPPEGESH